MQVQISKDILILTFVILYFLFEKRFILNYGYVCMSVFLCVLMNAGAHKDQMHWSWSYR